MLHYTKLMSILTAILTIQFGIPLLVLGSTNNQTTIYVSSSSGSDNNSGLAATSPVQTLAKAHSLMEDGYTALLKSGDVFSKAIYWNYEGIISSYGEGPRPIVSWMGFYNVSNLTIDNLHFRRTDPEERDAGFWYMFINTENFTVQNCLTESNTNIVAPLGAEARCYNVKILNSQFLDTHGDDVLEVGFYADRVSGLLIDNVTVDYSQEAQDTYADTIFDHCVYIQHHCDNVEIRNSTFGNAPTNGLKLNSPAWVHHNTFLSNSVGCFIGAQEPAQVAGGLIEDNIFIGAGMLNDHPRGDAINVGNAHDIIIRNNRFEDAGYPSDEWQPPAISIGGDVYNILVEDNVSCDWGGLRLNGIYDNVMLRRNVLEGNPRTVDLSVNHITLDGVKFRDNRYVQDINEPFWFQYVPPYYLYWHEWFADDLGSELYAEEQKWQFKNHADINADGSVDINDFVIFIVDYGTNEWQSDIDGNGVVNIQDFSQLLINWGS